MDSETAVIRSEINQTRAELDRKITALEVRAQAMRPRAVARRYMADNTFDYALGSMLTVIGAVMALRQYRMHRNQPRRLRHVLVSRTGW